YLLRSAAEARLEVAPLPPSNRNLDEISQHLCTVAGKLIDAAQREQPNTEALKAAIADTVPLDPP
ncbi:MAG: hypothetical protein GY930_11395, partial [bacterium]|nr:hypothetical protein [bacterium]